jgi:hypothetical protein
VAASLEYNMMPQQDKAIQTPSTTQEQHQLQYGILKKTIPSTEYKLYPVNPGEDIGYFGSNKKYTTRNIIR